MSAPLVKRRSWPGLFVVFEGLEGCGKSTQVKLLSRELRAGKHTVTTTREPGGTPLGRRLRKILLHDAQERPGPEEEFLMFLLDRQVHLRQVVMPTLRQGGVVLCDRYHYSTLAYQEPGGKALAPTWVTMSWAFIGNVQPDLVVLLDMDPATAFQRLEDRPKDKIESRGLAYFRRVRRRYLAQAAEDPRRFLVLDAREPANALAAAIAQAVEGRLV